MTERAERVKCVVLGGLLPCLLACLFLSEANAQVASGGSYKLDQAVIANGGGTSTGTGYRIDGTSGQSAAGGSLAGAPYAMNSGFWNFITPTAISVISSQNPSVFGQSVTFTATVTGVPPGPAPTGTVQFVIDGVNFGGPIMLFGGIAQTSTSSLSVNGSPHTVFAQYSGDTNFNTSSGSLSGGQIVNKASTTTGVTSSSNPSVFGQTVTFTATVTAVSPGVGTPTGTVNFLDGGIPIGGCQNLMLNGSAQAQCITSTLALGNHLISAVYSGDTSFNGSTGAMTGNPQVVNKANTTTAITNAGALGTPTNVGVSYPVTWSVVPVAPGAGTPTGTVTVSDGTDTCTAAVAVAICNLTSTTPGLKTITATYGGDANFNGSSASTPHTVFITISGNIKQFNGPNPPTNLAGVTVTLGGAASGTTTTDGGGGFVFTNLQAGTYTVTPNPATPAGGRVYDPTFRTYASLTTNITNANFLAYNAGGIPRDLRVGNGFVTPGQVVTLPLTLASQGTEAMVAFNLMFDTNLLSLPVVSCGTDAPGCALAVNTATPGKVGITVTPTAVFAAGSRNIVNVSFQTAPTGAFNTPITFAVAPTTPGIKDASNNPLPFTSTGGLVIFIQGKEADVETLLNGDTDVDIGDAIEIGEFAAHLVTGSHGGVPDFATSNEFQRADCEPVVGPFGGSGDGDVDLGDFIQAFRFANHFDPVQLASGPAFPIPSPGFAGLRSNKFEEILSKPRNIRVMDTTASAGSQVTVSIEMDAQPGDKGVSFTMDYDAAKLSNPAVSLGTGAAGAFLISNTDTPGKVAVQVAYVLGEFAAGTSQTLAITFDVAKGAKGGPTQLTFTDDLAEPQVRDANNSETKSVFMGGTITIFGGADTGAGVSQLVHPIGVSAAPFRFATRSQWVTYGLRNFGFELRN